MVVAFLLCCAAIAYIALTAPQRPRVAQLAFLTVAAFLLVNKVWSPQFSLWLVPLAVLALPHRRILLAWMTIDMLVWVPRMLYLWGEANKGLPEQWFTATVLIRDLAVIGLMVLVVRQIYRPELDLVRWGGRIDDPAGGVFDGAPDAYPARLPRWLRPRMAGTDPQTQGAPDAGRDSAVPRNTALDAVGPYEVLQRIPSIDVVWVGHQRGEVRSDNGMLGLICDATFEEITEPDVLVFPGGIGTRTLIHDDEVLSTGCAACTGRRGSPPRCAPAAWYSRPPDYSMA